MSAFLVIFEFLLKVSRFYQLRLVHEAGLLHFSVRVEILYPAWLQPDYLWTGFEVGKK